MPILESVSSNLITNAVTALVGPLLARVANPKGSPLYIDPDSLTARVWHSMFPDYNAGAPTTHTELIRFTKRRVGGFTFDNSGTPGLEQTSTAYTARVHIRDGHLIGTWAADAGRGYFDRGVLMLCNIANPMAFAGYCTGYDKNNRVVYMPWVIAASESECLDAAASLAERQVAWNQAAAKDRPLPT